MHNEAWTKEVPFADRAAAGRALAVAVQKVRPAVEVVVGLTRGGVPVAAEVANALGVPLDFIVVKKLRAPGSEELAIGALCADGTRVIHDDIVREVGASKAYIEEEVEHRLAEARSVEQFLRRGVPPIPLTGKVVAVVDDGVATGATMDAALLSVRRAGALRIVVAAPVAPAEAREHFRRVADEFVCLAFPPMFLAVGQFYEQFAPVGEDEVLRLVEQNRAATSAHRS